MAQVDLGLTRIGFGRTARLDRWWLGPSLAFAGLSAFVVYATWAAFQGTHYFSGPYLSPFYSPELFGDSTHSWFGPKPTWWPAWLLFSPALFVLWAPGGFRLTCYYYRGAYYKSFWADPPSCAVGEPRAIYRGEASLPLVLQNVHRYFLYLALPIPLVLAANVVLLGGYALGCHSLRHVVGGRLDRFSGSPVRSKAYDCASCLNRRHMSWAWCSLFSVAFADLYVRLCSMGVIRDWRIF